jgi:formate hydrogenlyase subunit 6/NADH:ubiquinone oxidoreductase subunit I
MIHTDGKGKGKGKGKRSPKIPVIDIERCIGCGACEHLCPARPFSAIYVEGHERHKEL